MTACFMNFRRGFLHNVRGFGEGCGFVFSIEVAQLHTTQQPCQETFLLRFLTLFRRAGKSSLSWSLVTVSPPELLVTASVGPDSKALCYMDAAAPLTSLWMTIESHLAVFALLCESRATRMSKAQA